MAERRRRGAHQPRIGIVGGGQLARMLLEAAIRLDVEVRALAKPTDTSLEPFDAWVTVGDPADEGALDAFVEDVDVLTFEHEQVPLDRLADLAAGGLSVRPGPDVLAMADKAHQRERLAALGIPVPPFRVARGPGDVVAFAAEHGWPVVVKAARGGYDGRGVFMIDDSADLARQLPDGAWADRTHVVEPRLPFSAELAVLVARRPGGQRATFPVVETVQRRGMCREVLVPPRVRPDALVAAREVGEAVADGIGSVGILAVELFVVDDGVVVNELAPRVHNSGHLTIEACGTSQFEQHLRAVADLPLGSPHLLVEAATMANVVGDEHGVDPRDRLGSAHPGPERPSDGAIHLYGKTPRPERKIGHVTVCGDVLASTHDRAVAAAAALTSPEVPSP